MATWLIALMVVTAAPSPNVKVRASDPLPLERLNDFVAPSTYAWSDDGWALKLRYAVATNFDVWATARGNVDLVRAEWVSGLLYARTDLRVRSFNALSSIDRGLTPDALASSVVLGSQFQFSTTMTMVPSVGVKFTSSPNVLSIRSLEDLQNAKKIPMQALVYIQIR